MIITFNRFSSDPAQNEAIYKQLRLQVISKVEESGEIKLQAYVDPVGIPTIGVGMNLQVQDPIDAALNVIFGVSEYGENSILESKDQVYRDSIKAVVAHTYPIVETKKERAEQTNDLRSKLDTIMANRAADLEITIPNKKDKFEFDDISEVQAAFDSLAPEYEKRVNSRVGTIDTVPYSYERLALFSLAYNSPSLLGQTLQNAITTGNRAEAWYQIRYNTNSATTIDKKTKERKPIPKATRNGISKRRYYESQIFSLYNDPTGDIGDEEAKSILEMHSKHAGDIVKYDDQFSDYIYNARKSFGTLALNGVSKVQNFRESMSRAWHSVITDYLEANQAKKINQISFTTASSRGIAAGSSSATDPLVIPYKLKSLTPQSQVRTDSISLAEMADDYYVDDDSISSTFDDDTPSYYDDTYHEEDLEPVSSLLIGESSSDTFYLPSLGGEDYIVSSVSDGIIQIGGSKLSGNALPATDSSGNQIADEWVLADSGLKLKKVGEDFEITKAGSQSETNKLTIKNFPFSNSRGAFGITLGKKKDSSLGDDVYVKTLTNSYFVQGAYPAASSEKTFFGAIGLTDSQGSRLSVSDEIAVFDQLGNLVTTNEIESVVYSSASTEMLTPSLDSGIKMGNPYYGNEGVFYPTAEGGSIKHYFESGSYATDFYSRVGAVLIDKSGNVLAANVFANTNSRTQEYGVSLSSPGFMVKIANPSELYFVYSSENGRGVVGRIVQRIDPSSLAAIGDREVYYYGSPPAIPVYQNADSFYTQPDVSNFNLASGARIAISNSGKTITSSMTKLRDLLPSEITPNYDVASGSQATNSQLAKQILTLGEATTLEVAANPNSVVAILNLDPATNPNSRLTFSNFDSSQVTAYATDSSQYSLDDLLSGSAKTSDMQLVYGATSARRLSNSFSFEDISPFDISSTYYNDYYEGTSYGNYTDDSVVEDDDELPDLIFSPYTLLELPSNQTVILVGVNGTELAKSPHSFFLTSENITQSPTSQPTSQPSVQPSSISLSGAQPSSQPSKQPSAIPTSEPTAQPSGQPTYLPTIGEVIMPTTNPSSQPTSQPSDFPTGQPTSQPSRQPFSNPSAVPSYKPQAIPSFKPKSQPSSQPTIQDTTNPSSQPTISPSEQLTFNPTTQPSSNPTSIPTKSTRNPSSQPSHHPIAGDLETNPTSQPSGNPSLLPSQSPSFKPQAIPSFKPTQQPAEQIRSENPTTGHN